MNNAVTNVRVQVFAWTGVLVSLGYVLRSGIAGPVVAQCLIIGGPTGPFSRWLPHLTVPPAVSGGSTLSMPSPALDIFRLFYFIHPSGREVVSLRGFDLHYAVCERFFVRFISELVSCK